MGFMVYDDLINEDRRQPEYICASSAEMKRNVEGAVKTQRMRYIKEGILYNSQLSPAQIKKYCALDKESVKFMKKAYDKMALSARGYHKMLKVARTIADVESADNINTAHLAEALRYRQWEG
jgi:magnesium chelatase family protein